MADKQTMKITPSYGWTNRHFNSWLDNRLLLIEICPNLQAKKTHSVTQIHYTGNLLIFLCLSAETGFVLTRIIQFVVKLQTALSTAQSKPTEKICEQRIREELGKTNYWQKRVVSGENLLIDVHLEHYQLYVRVAVVRRLFSRLDSPDFRNCFFFISLKPKYKMLNW